MKIMNNTNYTIDYLCTNQCATDGNGHFAIKRSNPYTGKSGYMPVSADIVDDDYYYVYLVSDLQSKIM